MLAASLAAAGGAGAVTLEEVGTYTSPVYVISDPGDSDRLFVVERQGRVMLTAEGRTSTFLDMRTLVPPFGGLTDRGDIPLGTWQARFVDWFRDLGFLQKPGVETKAARDVAAFVATPPPAPG